MRFSNTPLPSYPGFESSLKHRDVNSTISPCGICRQVLREFCLLDMKIWMVSGDYKPAAESATETSTNEDGEKDKVKETTMGELLPYSFGPEDLERPRGLEKRE